MITVPEKVLASSIIVFAFGLFFTAIYSKIHEKGDNVPWPVAIIVAVSLFIAPFVALGATIWMICSL